MTERKFFDFDNVIDRISFALFLQILLFQLTGFIPPGTFTAEKILFGILECLLYSLSFVLPAFILTKNGKNDNIEPISFEIKMPLYPLPTVFAFLGTVTTTSYISSFLLSALRKTGIGIHGFSTVIPDGIPETVLLFISSVILPPLCEELLFRKALLDKTRRYGDAFAILFSSLCFALMHCNITQFAYAFCAGIIMATVTLRTCSVFFSVLLHFLNNLISFSFSFIEKYASKQIYDKTTLIFDLSLSAIGIFSLAFLIMKDYFKPEKSAKKERISLLRFSFIIYILIVLYLTSRWFYKL